MNLQQLEYIIAVDKFKSFSKAAEACHITQATLSTMIKKLEDELDLVIFDRKSSPILTTDSGHEIIKEAQRVIFHSNRLKQLSSDIKGTIQGSIHIGIIPTVAGNLLHRIIPGILAKYPKLKLHIQEITTANIIHKLKTNELDAGIISTPFTTHDIEEEILYYEKLMVYGSTGGKSQRYLNPRDITGDKLWLLEDGNCLTDQIINVCSLKLKKVNHNLQFTPGSFESLLHIVDEMKGMTLIPELYVMDLPDERRKLVKDFVAPHPVREISMVYNRPYAKLRTIKALSEEIRQCIQPLLQTSKLKNSQMTIARI